MDDDITIIKSLIAISKGGLLLKDIQREYRDMNGYSLNFRKYGFESIEQMLQSSKDIVLRPSVRGTLCQVHDEKMSHVTSLVDRTKTRGAKKNRPGPKLKSYNHSRGFSPQPRYGVSRRGSVSELNRRPFQPANRMQYDNHRRAASPRTQAVSRFPATSHKKQYSQNYHHHPQSSANHFERSKRNEPQPLQSNAIGSTVSIPLKTTDDTSSGWSSDSSEPPHTIKPSEPAVRKPSEPNLRSQTVVKAQAVNKACQVIKGSSTTSDSDWSSLESESAASRTDVSKKITTHPRINYPSVPLQNDAAKLRPQLKTKSDSNSDWSDSSGHSKQQPSQSSSSSKPSSSAMPYAERPLMVGGVGRGRAYLQLSKVKPEMHRLQHPSTGSPCNRETSRTVKDGLSTILVKVRKPAIAIPKLKEVTTLYQLPNFASYQFIGDFLLHRVAEVTLGLKFPENRGLCRCHFSIVDCIKEIRKNGSSRPIILMIGMTDILEGATFDEMKKLTTLLLQTMSARSIVLLTLPVLPSFIQIGFESKLAVLEKYNKWLLNLPLQRKFKAIIETEQYLYCDAPFYSRTARSEVETFSDAGCWVVIDEITAAATK
ncbi:uncharacterized protein LOC117638900 isoform X2 [Thrips palmi]|uniref:Uncharacterized protein LOC117638900 isoform X2 n=1 Tax=Thrips palmi TaxID=161013 RepID=A0A6P8Y1U8_THRPL|nr:uncharacterized protein LOC117638900 isoform X2 [Thrips palmi]